MIDLNQFKSTGNCSQKAANAILGTSHLQNSQKNSPQGSISAALLKARVFAARHVPPPHPPTCNNYYLFFS